MNVIRPGQTYRSTRGRHAGKLFAVAEIVKRDNAEVWVRLMRGARGLDIPASELLGKAWARVDLARLTR